MNNLIFIFTFPNDPDISLCQQHEMTTEPTRRSIRVSNHIDGPEDQKAHENSEIILVYSPLKSK
jgi:hypothetical protein